MLKWLRYGWDLGVQARLLRSGKEPIFKAVCFGGQRLKVPLSGQRLDR